MTEDRNGNDARWVVDGLRDLSGSFGRTSIIYESSVAMITSTFTGWTGVRRKWHELSADGLYKRGVDTFMKDTIFFKDKQMVFIDCFDV